MDRSEQPMHALWRIVEQSKDANRVINWFERVKPSYYDEGASKWLIGRMDDYLETDQ